MILGLICEAILPFASYKHITPLYLHVTLGEGLLGGPSLTFPS